MKVYVAAPYPCRDHARTIAGILQARGHEITSSWHVRETRNDAGTAHACCSDLKQSEAVVAWNPPQYELCGTGGRHVEVGYALAHNLPVIVVGGSSNVFHHLCFVVGSVADAIDVLADLQSDRARVRIAR